MTNSTEDKEYNQLLDDLGRMARGEDIGHISYIAMPLSDVSATARAGKEVTIPDLIPDSFYWSSGLLKCKRSLGRIEGRVPHSTLHGSFTCPECGSTSTEQIKYMSIEAHHCIKCSLIWQSYPCWCMLCGGYLWSEQHDTTTVKCDKCHTEWAVDTVQSAHSSGDIFVEDL